MAYPENTEWKKYFGTAWENVINNCSEPGGFLILHKEKQVLCDSNFTDLTGMRKAPAYDQTVQIITALKNGDDQYAKLAVSMTEDNEDVSAGIIFGRKDINEVTLPVCTQTELAVSMNESEQPFVLALMRIEAYNDENIGDSELYTAFTAILGAAPKGTLISPASRLRYWLYVPGLENDRFVMLDNIRRTVEEAAVSTGYPLTMTAGCAADVPTIPRRMQTAEFAFYEATTLGKGSIRLYSTERYERHKKEYDAMRRFLTLVDNNLFIYHFQPIVRVSTGEIAAYEALMRTDSKTGLYPLEILDFAGKFNRLYDIERATIRNSLKVIEKHQDIFHDRKLFVNSITAHMLTNEDWSVIEQSYGELLEKVVIKFSEQTEFNDERLSLVRSRLERNNMQLAIDDYGTGYSNAAKLTRFKPDYVKLDRSLIQEIDSRPKVRSFVSGIISFIHENGFEVLAEGIETYEELKTMIALGADYVQGYYVSLPKPVLIQEISEKLKNEIVAINGESKGNITRLYHASNGELVDLAALEDQHYAGVIIDSTHVTLEGGGRTVKSSIVIKDGTKTVITMRNVAITTEKEEPLIILGANTDVILMINGENRIIERGIRVPKTSNLTLRGEGSLYVISQLSNCCGIGEDKDHSPGNIRIEMNNGKLNIEANGDNAIAIGGGKNEANNTITISGGDIKVSCSGKRCLGIGIMEGNSIIDINNCACSVETSSPTAVGIGSMHGKTDILAAHYKLFFRMLGIDLCAIGTIEDGSGNIILDSGNVTGTLNGRNSNCIGTRGGCLDCTVRYSGIEFVCEGKTVSGVGDMRGDGNVDIMKSTVDINMSVKDGEGIASFGGRIKLTNVLKNIVINS